MNASPYRTNANPNPESVPAEKSKTKTPGIESLTDGELALWDAVYVAAVGDACPPVPYVTCAKRADIAVAARRERFGVR